MVEAEATEGSWDLIKAGATKPDEAVVAQGLEASKPFLKQLIKAQQELAAQSAKPIADYPLFPPYSQETYDAVAGLSYDDLKGVYQIDHREGPRLPARAPRHRRPVPRRGPDRSLYSGSRRFFHAFGAPGRALYRGIRGGAHGFLSRLTNNEALYSNLDIKYLGPIHGHDIAALTEALEQAKNYGAPVIVHAIDLTHSVEATRDS